jgi:hypothetical protein
MFDLFRGRRLRATVGFVRLSRVRPNSVCSIGGSIAGCQGYDMEPSVDGEGWRFVQSSHHVGVSHRAVMSATLVRRAIVEITTQAV